jgi:hypothetical protein
VNGHDFTTNSNYGLTEGEPISFKLYRAAEGETRLNVTFDPAFNTGTFHSMGVSIITEMKTAPLGIGDNSVDFSIYPNPSNGIFHILSSNANITVINAQGQVVHQTAISGNTTLDLRHLGQGIYYIQGFK